ncbi:DNA repair protein RecO [Flavihumibacter petaseus]|uniref:DNA repair protein RecO n=1 Tax=Flavihumibacter petaseus NBRC 106054 TaxID=1220578 RepID=A0A0E9MW35_9BACT|nr:DNA repair protein RecO [Flavihumibacter petaseus]GAO41804.1 DNA repair protein RecO [Flavihumibacter petaseus NBRC 106054]
MTLFPTKGIVLRSVKYGETSVIVAIFTERFGLQSYIVNGIRTATKKTGPKGNPFQPAALLDLVVYHQDQKNIHRIKEYHWDTIYAHLYSDIFKASVATFMVELLQKCLTQPEENEPLFAFMEDALQQLDKTTPAVVANYPVFFAIHLANFFGFRIADARGEGAFYLDLEEGVFTREQPAHQRFLDPAPAAVISQLLKVMQPSELEAILLTGQQRRQLLQALEAYYALHLPGFGNLRSLPVLQEVLG